MNANKVISLDREDMSDFARSLFLKDIKRVAEEYFECDGDLSLEITRSEGGFLVCVLSPTPCFKSVNPPL